MKSIRSSTARTPVRALAAALGLAAAVLGLAAAALPCQQSGSGDDDLAARQRAQRRAAAEAWARYDPSAHPDPLVRPTRQELEAAAERARREAYLARYRERRDALGYHNADTVTEYRGGLVLLGRDARTGDVGAIALAQAPGIARQMIAARAGAGAVAVLARGKPVWRHELLDALAGGASATAALEALTAGRPTTLQAIVLDGEGRAAGYTGIKVLGSPRTSYVETAADRAAGGNMLAPVPAIEKAMEVFAARDDLPLPERLIHAVEEAVERPDWGLSNGDGYSAALLVVRPGGGIGGSDDRFVDCAVDADPEPMIALRVAYEAWVEALLRPRLLELNAADPDPTNDRYRQNLHWLRRLRMRKGIGER